MSIAARLNSRITQVAQRAADSHQLLVNAGIALAIMAVLALLAGWLVAGRVLQPLEDSYRAQRQFVANASHELRAPLTRQRALIEVALASSDANFASLRKAHERVLASEQHLEQLIDALLALTRGQAGLERRERSDLAVLATRALQAQRPDVERLRLDVDTTLDPAPTTGDPRPLERLITNLIDNAIRHNTPAGHLEITTGTRDRHAFLAIANTGPTIPPEQMPVSQTDAPNSKPNNSLALRREAPRCTRSRSRRRTRGRTSCSPEARRSPSAARDLRSAERRQEPRLPISCVAPSCKRSSACS